MRRAQLFLAFLLAAMVSTGTAAGSPSPHREDLFPRPASLEPQVRFWRAIFTDYSEHQVVLHDTVDLDKVYKVLDFRPYVDRMTDVELLQFEREQTREGLETVRATLRRLHEVGAGAPGLSPDEQHVARLFRRDSSPDKFLEATERLRSQRGLQEKFAGGLETAHRLLPEMEQVFREYDLPVELTRMPLIESTFNVNAYSKVGAAGIWQFMPATGRRFMRVNAVVDDRRDPIVSTRAAARYLREMHRDLGSWPLAITGWNHGPDGIARAARTVGSTDIAAIVREYRGAGFGFASRNFYAEFLAALDAERASRRESVPDRDRPRRLREHRLEQAMHIEQAAVLSGTDRATIVELNPALQSDVREGREPIPSGYALVLPDEAALTLASRTEVVEPDPEPRPAAERSGPRRSAAARSRASGEQVVTHRVRSGQTLAHIAKRYRVSVTSLRSSNGLGRRSRLKAGQVLRIRRSA